MTLQATGEKIALCIENKEHNFTPSGPIYSRHATENGQLGNESAYMVIWCTKCGMTKEISVIRREAVEIDFTLEGLTLNEH